MVSRETSSGEARTGIDSDDSVMRFILKLFVVKWIRGQLERTCKGESKAKERASYWPQGEHAGMLYFGIPFMETLVEVVL